MRLFFPLLSLLSLLLLTLSSPSLFPSYSSIPVSVISNNPNPPAPVGTLTGGVSLTDPSTLCLYSYNSSSTESFVLISDDVHQAIFQFDPMSMDITMTGISASFVAPVAMVVPPVAVNNIMSNLYTSNSEPIVETLYVIDLGGPSLLRVDLISMTDGNGGTITKQQITNVISGAPLIQPSSFSFHPTIPLVYIADPRAGVVFIASIIVPGPQAVNSSSTTIVQTIASLTLLLPGFLRGAIRIEQFSQPGAFQSPTSIVVNSQGTAAFVSDSLMGMVFQMDLSTGSARSLVSTGLLISPQQVQLDPTGANLYVSDTIKDEIYYLNIQSGSIFPLGLSSLPSPPNPNQFVILFNQMEGNTAVNLLVLLDNKQNLVLQYTLSSSTATVNNQPFTYPVYNPTGNAAQSVGGQSLAGPSAVQYSALNEGYIYVLDSTTKAVFKSHSNVNLPLSATVSTEGVNVLRITNPNSLLVLPMGFTLWESGNIGWISDSEQGMIFSFPLSGGDLTLISSSTSIINPVSIKYSTMTNTLYVCDSIQSQIFAVNVTTGSATPFTAVGAFGSQTKLTSMDLDDTRGILYVTDGFSLSLSMISLTGTTAGKVSPVVSFVTDPQVLRTPIGLSIDPSTQYAWITDTSDAAVYGVDLNSGAFEQLKITVGANVPNIVTPSAISVDPSSNQLYIADYASHNVRQVNVTSFNANLQAQTVTTDAATTPITKNPAFLGGLAAALVALILILVAIYYMKVVLPRRIKKADKERALDASEPELSPVSPIALSEYVKKENPTTGGSIEMSNNTQGSYFRPAGSMSFNAGYLTGGSERGSMMMQMGAQMGVDMSVAAAGNSDVHLNPVAAAAHLDPNAGQRIRKHSQMNYTDNGSPLNTNGISYNDQSYNNGNSYNQSHHNSIIRQEGHNNNMDQQQQIHHQGSFVAHGGQQPMGDDGRQSMVFHDFSPAQPRAIDEQQEYEQDQGHYQQ